MGGSGLTRLSEKYISPSVILPLETNAYISFPMSANFGTSSANFPMSATFLQTKNTAFVVPGTAIGVPASGTATIATITVAQAQGLLNAIQGSGDTDCTFFLSINNVDVFRFLTNIIVPNMDYKTQVSLNRGDVIRLYVVNNGTATGTFTGSITGVF